MTHTHTPATGATTETPTNAVQVAIVGTNGSVAVQSWTPENGESLLKPMQAAVEGYIEAVALSADMTMIVNEEGLYGCEPNPVATVVAAMMGRRSQPYFGTAVFVGGVDAKGNDESLASPAVEFLLAAAAATVSSQDLMEHLRSEALTFAGR